MQQPDRNHSQVMWPMQSMQACGVGHHFRPRPPHYIENLLHDRWPKQQLVQSNHWGHRLHHDNNRNVSGSQIGQTYTQDTIQTQCYHISSSGTPNSQCYVQQQNNSKQSKNSNQNSEKFLSIASLAEPASSSFVPILNNQSDSNPFMNNWNASVTNSTPLPSMFNFLPMQTNVQNSNDSSIMTRYSLPTENNDLHFCSPTKTSEASSRIKEIANELRSISFPSLSPNQNESIPSHSVSKLIEQDNLLTTKQNDIGTKTDANILNTKYQTRSLTHMPGTSVLNSCAKHITPNQHSSPSFQQRQQHNHANLHQVKTSGSRQEGLNKISDTITLPLSHQNVSISTKTSSKTHKSTDVRPNSRTLLQTIASSNLSLNLNSKNASTPLTHLQKSISIPHTTSSYTKPSTVIDIPNTNISKTNVSTTNKVSNVNSMNSVGTVQTTSGMNTLLTSRTTSVIPITKNVTITTAIKITPKPVPNVKENTKIATKRKASVEQNQLPIEYLCDFCKESFTNECLLIAHMKIHESPGSSQSTLLLKPKKKKPAPSKSTTRHVCSVCQQMFSRKDVMTRHARRHRDDYKRDECEECGATFTERRSLLRHQARAHANDAENICKDCNARFKLPKQLASHSAAKHGNMAAITKQDNSYECEECKKIFKSSHHLRAHLRVHTGEKPFTCNEKDCKKTYKSHHALVQHISVNHNHEKKFKCTVAQCTATFTAKSSLNDHLNLHRGDKTNICYECGQSFHLDAELKKHFRVHNISDRPYKCDQCPAKFKLTSHLAAHKRLHNGKSGKSSVTCSTTTVLNSSSTIKSTSPKCQQCGQTCANRAHLSVHMRREHNAID